MPWLPLLPSFQMLPSSCTCSSSSRWPGDLLMHRRSNGLLKASQKVARAPRPAALSPFLDTSFKQLLCCLHKCGDKQMDLRAALMYSAKDMSVGYSPAGGDALAGQGSRGCKCSSHHSHATLRTHGHTSLRASGSS
jgi:hypothetical protein